MNQDEEKRCCDEPELEDCEPFRQMLARFGDKWTVAIVAVLGNERMRFKHLHRSVAGISQRVLTACLRNLERDGLMVRTVHSTVPPRVEYELSDRGRSVWQALGPLRAWTHAHWAEVEASRRRFDSPAGKS